MMVEHTFRWPYPAHEVIVTGTFDEWQRSIRLQRDNKSGIFSATIDLGDREKTLYKFIVDGIWTVLNTARTETDHSGYTNNVLLKHEMSAPQQSTIVDVPPEAFVDNAPKPTVIEDSAAPVNAGPSAAAQALIQSAAPESSAANLAASVPLSRDEPTESPAPELPTPGMNDLPGGFPETPAAGYEKSNPVEQQTFSVNPMPASTTPGNPVDLKPGQSIPRGGDLSTQTVDDTVKLDKESYERADASNLGVGGFLPPVVTPAALREERGTGVLDIPGITGNMIPESSLPITSPEKKQEEEHHDVMAGVVPDVVKHSQKEAHVEPEASAVPEVVEAKHEVELEIEREVPEAPVTSPAPTTAVVAQTASGLAAQAKDAVNAAVLSGTAAVSTVTEKVGNLAGQASAVVSEKVGNASEQASTLAATKSKSAPSASGERPVESVPEVVKESQAIAHFPPEASANPTAVQAKAAVEDVIVHKVSTSALSPPTNPEVATAPAENVPEIVKESQAEAHVAPEAAGHPAAVALKSVVEKELKSEVKPVEEAVKAVGEQTGPGPATTHNCCGKPVLNAGTTAVVASSTIRTVEPETVNGNKKENNDRPVSPGVSPLSTPPATATTATFTTPVPGTTFNTTVTNPTTATTTAATTKTTNSSTSSASSTPKTEKLLEKDTNGTTSPVSKTSTNGTEKPKREKRRSIILNKIKNVFK